MLVPLFELMVLLVVRDGVADRLVVLPVLERFELVRLATVRLADDRVLAVALPLVRAAAFKIGCCIIRKNNESNMLSLQNNIFFKGMVISSRV